MIYILYHSIISLLFIVIGLFYKKICQLIIRDTFTLPSSELFIIYTQISLFITGVIYFILSILEYFFIDAKEIIQLYKIIFILICATLVTISLVYISKGTKSHTFFVIYFIIYILALGYATFDMYILNSSRNINILPNKIEIKGDYKISIPFKSIVNLDVTDSIPKPLSRTDGIEFMNFKKGYFSSRDGNRYYLYLKSKSSPFIIIMRDNDIPVIFNCKTPEETMILHSKINKNITTKFLE